MQRVLVTFAVLVCLLSGCRKEKPRPVETFDPSQFITRVAQASRSSMELATLASTRAREPETKQLGLAVAQEQRTLHSHALALARRRGLTLAVPIEQRKIALRENLLQLPGQVFDRTYALATVQDHNAMIRWMQQAQNAEDAELRDFARRHLQMLTNRQKAARALLGRLGGSPFGFE